MTSQISYTSVHSTLMTNGSLVPLKKLSRGLSYFAEIRHMDARWVRGGSIMIEIDSLKFKMADSAQYNSAAYCSIVLKFDMLVLYRSPAPWLKPTYREIQDGKRRPNRYNSVKPLRWCYMGPRAGALRAQNDSVTSGGLKLQCVAIGTFLEFNLLFVSSLSYIFPF